MSDSYGGSGPGRTESGRGGPGRTGFTAAAALGLAFQELSARLGFYLALTLVFSGPGLLLNAAYPIQPLPDENVAVEELEAFLGQVALAAAVGVVTYAATVGAMTYAVVAGRRGAPIGLGKAVFEGVGRIVYTLPTLLAQSAIIIAGGALLVALLGPIGSVLAAIGAVVLVLYLFVSGPVAAAEDAWPPSAFSRSIFLTDGYRGAILAILLAVLGISLAAGLALGAVGLAALGPDGLAQGPAAEGFAFFTLASLVISLPVSAFTNMLPAVVYYLLAVEKDGRDDGEVQQVFQ